MSMIMDVIHNKNKVQRAQSERRKQSMTELRNISAFKAALHDELANIGVILESPEVEYVVIEVADRYLAKFTGAIFDSVTDFEITQVDGQPNRFIVKNKMVAF